MLVTEITGNQLFRLLAEVPSDAWPSGVIESADGDVIVSDNPVQPTDNFRVWNNCRDVDAMSVNSIDTDWSVDRA